MFRLIKRIFCCGEGDNEDDASAQRVSELQIMFQDEIKEVVDELSGDVRKSIVEEVIKDILLRQFSAENRVKEMGCYIDNRINQTIATSSECQYTTLAISSENPSSDGTNVTEGSISMHDYEEIPLVHTPIDVMPTPIQGPNGYVQMPEAFNIARQLSPEDMGMSIG